MLPTCEGLDDDDVSAGVWTWWMIIRWFFRVIVIVGRWSNREQLAGERDVGLVRGAGEQAIMADTVEAGW